MARVREGERRPGGKPEGVGQWARSPGEYILGESHLAELQLVATEVEARWGVGRARLLVGPELREKFDRQRYLLNQAIFHGRLDDIVLHSKRMQAAWRAVDAKAKELGASPPVADVWEVALADGRVLALARTSDAMSAYVLSGQAQGREVTLWDVEEVARMVSAEAFVTNIKVAFPGAVVEKVGPIVDPLQTIPDAGDPLDDHFF